MCLRCLAHLVDEGKHIARHLNPTKIHTRTVEPLVLLLSLPLQCDNNVTSVPTTPSALITVLIQVDALPRTQGQASLSNRHIQTNPHERGFDVARHVVVAFHGVPKGAVSGPLRRCNFVEGHFHVSAYIWIGVLINS